MDANASPLNPYVVMRARSENVDNLEVVKRSANMGRSVFFFLKTENLRNSLLLQMVRTYANATPIILDLKQLQSSIFHSDSNGR